MFDKQVQTAEYENDVKCSSPGLRVVRQNPAGLYFIRKIMIRILIIADQPAISKALLMNLTAETDFEVVGVAGNLETTLRLTQQTNPNVMIIDVDMPGADGIWVSTRVRSLFPSVKIVFLSHHDCISTQSHVENLGAAFVLKSMPANTLISTIREILRTAPQKTSRRNLYKGI
jgi:DNA-binding NarL/FixJ family response regulator